ncbi:MAG: hypothetical protein GX616_10065 [Planctomycetes bacterium]|nr:hypothetical protein [Planctomycetota bacterium]
MMEPLPQTEYTTFGALAIGECFHDGISNGSGQFRQTYLWIKWQKTGPTRATCVEQHGYGNQRLAGMPKTFGRERPVWRFKEDL